MKTAWLVLIVLTFAAWIIPAYRFRKSRFFFFFLLNVLIDPSIAVLSRIFSIPTYNFFPFVTVVLFYSLPEKNNRIVLLTLISAIVLIQNFSDHSWLPLLIATINALFIINFFSAQIYAEYKKDFTVSLFLIFLLIDSLKNIIKIFLFYRFHNLFTELYDYILAFGFLIPLFISYFGIEKRFTLKRIYHKESGSNISEKESAPEEISEAHYPHLDELKKRELEILTVMSMGQKQNDIARNLYISRKTVYFHVRNIKDKLNIKSTEELYHFAITFSGQLKKLLQFDGSRRKKFKPN